MPLTNESALRKDEQHPFNVKLQHRHFAFIAGVIATLPSEYRDEVAMTFVKALQRTNPKFDSARFQVACKAWD